MNNSFIRSITSRDLHQRYGSSYWIYNNKPIWCQSIEETPDGELITYFPLHGRNVRTDDRIREVINRSWINTNRPNSGWYLSENLICFFYWNTHKQYHRGLIPVTYSNRDGNCFLLFPYLKPSDVPSAWTVKLVESILNNKTMNYTRIPKEVLMYRTYNSQLPTVLRHNIAIVPGKEYGSSTSKLYFKNVVIGYLTENKKIKLLYTRFKPEFKETIMGLNNEDFLSEEDL